MTWPILLSIAKPCNLKEEGLQEGRGLHSVCISAQSFSGISIEIRCPCSKLPWTIWTTSISHNLCNLTLTLTLVCNLFGNTVKSTGSSHLFKFLFPTCTQKRSTLHVYTTWYDFIFCPSPHNALACKASVARALRCPRLESILMAHRPRLRGFLEGIWYLPHWMIIWPSISPLRKNTLPSWETGNRYQLQ